jgi:hypothetical protein
LQVKLERTHHQKRKKKRKQIDLKTKEINWLKGKKKSNLSIENKLLIYKAVISGAVG